MPKTLPKPKAARRRTKKQQEAARNNGRKSQGPKTEAGKAVSRNNSTKHGLFSITLFALDIENSEAFHNILESFVGEWRPSGPTEESLVHSLAFETISLQRFRMMEAQSFNSMTDRLDLSIFKDRHAEDVGEVLAGSFELFCKHKCLPNLEFIERSIARSGRNFRASLTSLLQLRKSGQPAQPKPQRPLIEILPNGRILDHRPPTPPGEPSESLERRIAEFKRQEALEAAQKENAQTNPGPTQPTTNQDLAAHSPDSSVPFRLPAPDFRFPTSGPDTRRPIVRTPHKEKNR